jgi:hypothetical protein
MVVNAQQNRTERGRVIPNLGKRLPVFGKL